MVGSGEEESKRRAHSFDEDVAASVYAIHRIRRGRGERESERPLKRVGAAARNGYPIHRVKSPQSKTRDGVSYKADGAGADRISRT